VLQDDIINQNLLTNLLKDTGFKLSMLSSEKELIEKLDDSDNVSLILIDVDTDIMDGFAIAKNIKSMPKYSGISIFALTKDTHKKSVEKIISSGMQDYIAKPLSVDNLYMKLFDFLNEIDKHKQQENRTEDLKVYVYRELDVKHGLEHYNDNVDSYQKRLKEFIDEYKNSDDVLDSIVKTGHYHNLEKYVHDLKIISSKLGGHKLSNSASKLEEAFKERTFNKNSILLNRFKRDIQLFIKDIKRYQESLD
jgi:CheY-like chemotaxis protein